jgi:hypothetical protein
MYKLYIFLFITFFNYGCAHAFRCDETKVTIKVIDEQNRPIENALVTGGFFCIAKNNIGGDFAGHSDNKGFVSFQDYSHGELGYTVRKEGYYYTSSRYKGWLELDQGVQNGQWQPWNPTIEVLLKKIENPIPMYAKKVATLIPDFDKPIGFDLENGDWVSPHGGGAASDILFQVSRRGTKWEDFEITMTINFPNKGDGIQLIDLPEEREGSELRMPKKAPKNGYNDSRALTISNTPEKGRVKLGTDSTIGYIFQVRTILNDKGEVIRANYGKIDGEFYLTGYTQEKLGLHFTYYFNPDVTRNLEFDRKQNLFKNIKKTENYFWP